MNAKYLLTSCLLLIAVSMSLAQTLVYPGENTLSAAIAAADSGDVLELQAGVYIEANTLETSPDDLTIRGIEGAEVIIYGPTEPEEDADLMHVKSKNLWLENLILVGSDSSRNGIVNYYGGVTEAGAEKEADKNNIYINHCQFYIFDQNHIIILGSTGLWSNEIPTADDNLFHPVDTLRITDCYFYGADITNDRAIYIGRRQARYVEVRRSTLWSLGQDGLEVKGFYIGDPDTNDPPNDPDYITTIADHLTIYNTYNESPEQYNGRGGDGIHYEYASSKQIMSNCIVLRTHRFCFKAKRGCSPCVHASYCIGDSGIYCGCYSGPTVFYWYLIKDSTSFEANPEFIDTKNGDFSLSPTSPARAAADPNSPDGPNMGDPHWNDSTTCWPNLAQIKVIIQKAKDAVVGVKREKTLTPGTFVLRQNYPNPFNATTAISYSIPEVGYIWLEIYDITGRKVRTLIKGIKTAGDYSIVWDAHNDRQESVASGLYLCRLQCGSAIKLRKMLFLR